MMRKRYWLVWEAAPGGDETYLGRVLQTSPRMAELQAQRRWPKRSIDGAILIVRSQVP